MSGIAYCNLCFVDFWQKYTNYWYDKKSIENLLWKHWSKLNQILQGWSLLSPIKMIS